MEFQKVPELRQFTVKIFVHSIESFLQILFSQFTNRIVCRVMVHIGQKDSLGERRFDVFTGTTISVTACTNLDIRKTVSDQNKP